MPKKARVGRAVLFGGIPIVLVALGLGFIYMGNTMPGFALIVLGPAFAAVSIVVLRRKTKQVTYQPGKFMTRNVAPLKCPKCGYQIFDQYAESCPKCGYRLRQVASQRV
jgi:ribosomal protein L37E